MKITVLAGGVSPEHDVSIISGTLASKALTERGHDVALCDVALPVKDQPSARFGAIAEDGITLAPPKMKKEKYAYGKRRLIGEGVIDLCLKSDVVFLALHGGMGEDGHIQALLESFGVVFTGSDMASCHAAMDKYISKLICSDAGIPVPDWNIIKKGGDIPRFDFPAVIKPCSCGSSVGVSFVENSGELKEALAHAFEYEDKVIAERKIKGREFSVSVLGDTALPAVEIIPKSGVYDFESKYRAELTDEICPARLLLNQEQEVERAALMAHRALGLGDYSRSDFILDEKEDRFYYLETNALPGMTNSSLLPRAAKASGIGYGELCEKICLLALERTKK